MAVTHTASGAVPDDVLDQVVTGTRLVGALIAESLAGVRPAVTAAQWRVLVLASEGGCNVSAVADDLSIHRSNATRLCDRMVEAGLLRRRRSAEDGRQVLLAVTPAGRRLFNRAMNDRRTRLAEALSLMTPDECADLARCLTRLTEAAAEVKMTRHTTG